MQTTCVAEGNMTYALVQFTATLAVLGWLYPESSRGRGGERAHQRKHIRDDSLDLRPRAEITCALRSSHVGSYALFALALKLAPELECLCSIRSSH
jgi:hypothetical protein